MRVRCPENLFFAFASLPPYIYKSDDSKITGIFSSFLNDAVQFWCAGKTNITYTEVGNGFGDLERHIVNNSADFIFPMPGRLKMKHFLGRPYIPIIESPGIAFFSSEDPQAGHAIVDALSNGWPALVIVILSAMVAGMAFWFLELTRESRQTETPVKEKVKFSTEALFRGFYWAMVTMTTVGYGDFYPKSTVGRLLATMWILTGTIIISLFTASITTILLAACLANDVTLNQAQISVIQSSTEYRLAVKRNAIPFEVASVQEIVQLMSSGKVEGSLLDSFVAGYYQESFNSFRLVEIIEHVFAYGVVLSGKGLWMERQIREFTQNNKEKLFNYMSLAMRPLKPNKFGSAAVEKSTSLLDINNNAMYSTLLVLTSLIAALVVIGNIWDRCYLRKRKEVKERRQRARTLSRPGEYAELGKIHLKNRLAVLNEIKTDIENFQDLLRVQLALAQKRSGLIYAEDDLAISNIELVS